MNSGKADNQLNLALDIPVSEREKTRTLDIGYNAEENTWELIVKYNGDLRSIQETLGFEYVALLNGYAVLTIEEYKINRLLAFPEIEFIEKPMAVYFEVANGRVASCVPALQTEQYNLFGEGVLVAIIDSGIDYSHPDFRNDDGTTRILYLWDQSIKSDFLNPTNLQEGESFTPPPGFNTGTLFTEAMINRALEQRIKPMQLEIVPSVDLSGHGTHVAGIAAGNGRASKGRYKGVATKSTLLVVKLGMPLNESFPRTTQLMTAVDFVMRVALERKQPLAINISFGNNYGSHDGNSIIESYLTDLANMWKTSIVVGTGNEGGGRSHTSGLLNQNIPQTIELAIGGSETGMSIQLWKNYYDDFEVTLIHPSGRRVGPIPQILGKQQFRISNTNILLYFGEPKPMNRAQEIYFQFIPTGQFIDTGIWKFELTPIKIVNGNYDFWIPSAGALGEQTGFLFPVSSTTLTIPSTSPRVISVGAYNSNVDSYAYFSGRGFTRGDNFVKPDIVAPGVDINAAAPGGGYAIRSGTSMATPFVTGAAAMLMQWGIVQGNDPFLYGEKLKAYLINGARKLPGFDVWPNPQLGYGALCVRNSIPNL